MSPNESLSTDGNTVSVWQTSQPLLSFEPLSSDTEADVCVVGAGIAGLTTAYLLAKEGRSVVVLDDSAIGDGQTGRTSAHLTSAIDDRFASIIKMHGEQTARLHYQSHAAAIDKIESIARDENIDCDFARIEGYLFLSPDKNEGDLKEEFDAANKLGVPCSMVGTVPMGSHDVGLGIAFADQARFHPLKYLNGLARVLRNMGVNIYTGTHVSDVQGGQLSKGELCVSKTSVGREVRSKSVVVATNVPSPINDWAGLYTKQAPYRTYVVGFEIAPGSIDDALFWDMADPYHYVRLFQTENDSTIVLVGGADHKVGQGLKDSDPFKSLEDWTRKYIPSAGRVVSQWSGQVQEPNDGIAFIGEAPTAKPNVYAITGDSGMGLTHATLGAILITDLIQGRENPWREVYDPSRKPTASKTEFIKENTNAMATYTEYLTPGEVSDESDIAPGTGAIVRQGLKKLAVYRDDNGHFHRMSAACTHLGCIVHWNRIEGSWDCPCHGSRFNAEGEVIVGPAIDGLSEADAKE